MLCTRLAHHVSKHNKTTSRTIIDRGDYEICLIENYPCSSKDELHMRERFFIETLDNCVNKYIPGRTKEEKLEYKKEWYVENKTYILDYKQQNKEKIRDKKKVYHQNNRADILEKKKIYRQQNRKIINKKQRDKYQAKKQNPQDHREQRREYWANLKEINKVPLSQPE